jgi:hypothetical protein
MPVRPPRLCRPDGHLVPPASPATLVQPSCSQKEDACADRPNRRRTGEEDEHDRNVMPTDIYRAWVHSLEFGPIEEVPCTQAREQARGTRRYGKDDQGTTSDGDEQGEDKRYQNQRQEHFRDVDPYPERPCDAHESPPGEHQPKAACETPDISPSARLRSGDGSARHG